MTQTPAAWFPDPEDPTQYRYWDGTAWTEHRSPRTSPAGDQLSQAGQDLADGLSKGFTAVGGWLNQNVPMPGQHTFASVAAACQDEPPREPLSHSVELVHAPTDLPALLPLFAGSSVALTPEGGTLEQSCRFVPNPWDPRDPTGVAVLVGTTHRRPVPGGRRRGVLPAARGPGLAQPARHRHRVDLGVRVRAGADRARDRADRRGRGVRGGRGSARRRRAAGTSRGSPRTATARSPRR